MRLTQKEIDSIKSVAREVFGEGTEVRLFGSRTDDRSWGGDIDLFINVSGSMDGAERYRNKLIFLVKLKNLIGDRKIDVLIPGGDKPTGKYESFMSNAISL